LDQALCPHCSYRVERDFIRCPSCLRKLKERCVSCSRPLDQAWTICPYCEADVPGLSAPRSRRRRGAPAIESEVTELSPPPASPEEAEAEPAEAALASEPAPARPRSSPRANRPGGRARPST
jgi:hypothetical protein